MTRRSSLAAIAATSVVTGMARLVTGVRGNWRSTLPDPRPRIYFANHRSHGDFVLIWTVLPRALRRSTRPVAAAAPPAQTQPEVNLDVPENLLATLPPPPPHKAPQAQPRPHPAPSPPYIVMNGMSYGHPSPDLPRPPAPPGMNMSLPQSDAQAVMGPELTVKGDAGADWGAALSKWVQAHAYYPAAAVAQKQQGTAKVEFDVDRQGNVSKLRLITSSGSTFLDQAWYGIFQGAQLPPFPKGAPSDHVTVDYTIQYELIGQ